MSVLLAVTISQALIGALTADSVAPSGDEILARIESENNRRRVLLKGYSGSRQYTIKNLRFDKQAEVAVDISYRQAEGESYTVTKRSGSETLNGIVDRVLASQAGASLSPENDRYQITAANYRVRLIGTDIAAGRNCYVLQLTPRMKNRSLIVGKAWVDMASYAVLRTEGRFAASLSLLVGTPRISQEFIEVNGFWLPGRIRSVTSTFLLGPTELDIVFSNYQVEPDAASLRTFRK